MGAVVRVIAFVDWDTARRIVPFYANLGQARFIERAIRELQDALAIVLSERDTRSFFRVGFRLYHGWHRGKTKTNDRIEIEKFLRNESIQRTVGKVSFIPELLYGDELLCGGRRKQLFDTLRRRDDGADEQKMVDTALVSDLLEFVRAPRESRLGVIVGDDDDLLPGVFTAEAWGRQVLILRLREDDNKHINSSGLIKRRRRSQ